MAHKEIDYRVTELERLVKSFGDHILKNEEEKGKLFRALAEEVKKVNNLQDDRLDVVSQYQKLNDDRFDYLTALVKTTDKRVLYIERALEILKREHSQGSAIRESLADDWEEDTGIRHIIETSKQSKALTSKHTSGIPEKPSKDTYKTAKVIGAITGLVAAIGTAIAAILQAW